MKVFRNFFNFGLSKIASQKIKEARQDPLKCQNKVLQRILTEAPKGRFGQDFNIGPGLGAREFSQAIPILSYEDYQPYINRIIQGEEAVFWEGRPKCIALSSGTTSGEKYIPIYQELLKAHYSSSLIAGFNFCIEQNDFSLLDQKLFYLTGLKDQATMGGVPLGRLSSIAKSKFPKFLLPEMYPPDELNQAETWDHKVKTLLNDIHHHQISLFAGTPPWLLNFLEQFKDFHGKSFGDQFPDFKLLIHSGCSFEPYRSETFRLIGDRPDFSTLEMLPASEGFMAFQDQWSQDSQAPQDMLLNVNSNIYFEFLPVIKGLVIESERCGIEGLEVGKEYAIILNVLGGFLGYQIGDNILVTCLNPIRLRFAGRSKFDINFVGEHMDYQTLLRVFLRLQDLYDFADFSILPGFDEGQTSKARYHWYFAVKGNQVPPPVSEVQDQVARLCGEFNRPYRVHEEAGNLLRPQVEFIAQSALTDYVKTKSSAGQNKVINVIHDPSIQKEFREFLTQKPPHS